MFRYLAAASFAALIAAASPPVLAQSAGAQPHHAQPSGSYRSQMRHQRGEAHRRARASAEHVRQMHAQ